MLAGLGMNFFDYGNSFLLESSRAGADVLAPGSGDGSKGTGEVRTDVARGKKKRGDGERELEGGGGGGGPPRSQV